MVNIAAGLSPELRPTKAESCSKNRASGLPIYKLRFGARSTLRKLANKPLRRLYQLLTNEVFDELPMKSLINFI